MQIHQVEVRWSCGTCRWFTSNYLSHRILALRNGEAREGRVFRQPLTLPLVLRFALGKRNIHRQSAKDPPLQRCARFKAFAAKYLRPALFWDVTQRTVVISCRRFGTTNRSLFQGWRVGYVSLFCACNTPLQWCCVFYKHPCRVADKLFMGITLVYVSHFSAGWQ